MKLNISSRIRDKLKQKHNVIPAEIDECFLNRTKGFLEDARLEHLTCPPTLWFIAETDKKRLLKVIFIELSNSYEIKTAYQPCWQEVNIYEKYA